MWAWVFSITIVVLVIALTFLTSKKLREDISDTFSTLFRNTKRAKKKREAKLEREKREYQEKTARRRAELEKARVQREAEKAELEKARAQREAERAELEKARAQREAEKAELEKARAQREAERAAYESREVEQKEIKPTPPPVKKKPLPYLFSNEQVMSALQKLDEITAKTAYRLSINHERTPDLFSTKLGGAPYWKSDMEYPTAADGTPLVLLAQINLSELESNNILPQSGLLQFFIEASLSNPAHRVVYHNSIDTAVTLETVLSLNIPTTLTCQADGLPLNKEFAVDVEKTTVSMGGCDYKLSERFNEAAEQIGLTLPEDAPEGTTLYSEAYRCMPDSFDERCEMNKGSWLLGYPHFAQEDVRYFKGDGHYDTLLFQLDSEHNPQTRNYEVIWGDAGVANFFINGEDLKNLDFSNTLFSTDCY